MEGYYNISGSHNAFDDFDIEGKKSFDDIDKQTESKFKPIGKTQTTEEADKQRLLDVQVDLDNGAVGYVFTVTGTGYNSQWKCHVCDMLFMGIKNLLFHETSMNHLSLMQASKHHSSQFTKMEMKDGEPKPPGVDDDEEVEPPVLTNLQGTLDDHKSSPLIGLEYVLELNEDYEKESAYVCMLCDKKGDPRTVMAHLVSYMHRLKYLERHFPITFNAINSLPKTAGARKGLAEIVLRISSEMEEKYGRLRPVPVDGRHFEENRFNLMCTINKSKHFIETPDKTFVHLVDRELLTAAALKTDEIPVPEGSPPTKSAAKAKEDKVDDDDEIEFQGAFVKGTRVPLTRQLRVRKFSIETEDKSAEGVAKLKSANENKKEDDVKSQCSLSSISSASSSPRDSRYKRSRYSRSRSRSRSDSRARRRRRSRSRSRGRYRRSRSRSRSRGRRSRSPYSSRRRLRSPRRAADTKREDDKKRAKEREDDLSQEKVKWEKFREEVTVVEKELLEKLAQHEKNPEKHPQYPEEWKLFWNKRYKELQVAGKDPNKHDFKPEWIEYWNRRMRELHEQEFMKKKEEIREKLNLPVDEPKPHFNRRKKFEGEGAVPGAGASKGRSRSPSPWEEGGPGAAAPAGYGAGGPAAGGAPGPMRGRERDRERDRDRDYVPYRGRAGGGADWRHDGHGYRDRSPPRTITVLRTLTALEQQLGSLGPRVNSVLSEAIALEKTGNSDVLLRDTDVVVLLETVREKFKGQLLAGIVERNHVGATRNAIGVVSELLYRAPVLLEHVRGMSPPRPPPALEKAKTVAAVHIPAPVVPTVAPKLPTQPSVLKTSTSTAAVAAAPAAPSPPAERVTVQGVGAVDKAAIAKEIAVALIAQGRTDVTEQELEQLVMAVVGMAQAKAELAAAEAAQAAAPAPPAAPAVAPAAAPPAAAPAPHPAPQPAAPVAAAPVAAAPVAKPPQQPEVTGLQLLQSAYDAEEAKQGGAPAPVPTPALRPAGQAGEGQGLLDKLPALRHSPAKAASAAGMTAAQAAEAVDAYVEELTETDLRLLLQSFKDLPLDEQHGLIRYLKRLEATDPVRVERLRKYVNLESNASKAAAKTVIPPEKLQALAKVGQSGRLSPFSSRQQSRNPSQTESKKEEAKLKLDSDSDDDYTFDDVCKAVTKMVSAQEAVEAEKRRAVEKAEEEKRRKAEEEMQRKLAEEKAKAEQALEQIEERERAQQRVEREQERLAREAAIKVGAANWPTLTPSPAGVTPTFVSSVPPPVLPPPPVPPSGPPPGMPAMYAPGYGAVSGPMNSFNGNAGYYPPNAQYPQYPQREAGFDQQNGYYQGQQGNSSVYPQQQQQQQQQYNSQGYGGYGNNAMYQQPPQGQQGYPVGPYGNQYHY